MTVREESYTEKSQSIAATSQSTFQPVTSWIEFRYAEVYLPTKVHIFHISEYITTCSKSPSCETVTCLVNKFPNIYVTQRFNITYTTACHWSLPWVKWLCSKSSHSICLRHIFNSFLTFCPSLASCLFPTDCLTKSLYVPSMSCAQHAPCSHPIW